MKRKKGFTLIELLAVIVILGVIALIAVPTVFHLIEKSRMEAFKESVINSFSSLDYYLIQKTGKGTFDQGIPPEKGISIDELDLKDDFTKGHFITTDYRFNGILDEGSVISYYIQNDRYCSYGPKKALKVARKDADGNCFSLDDTGPEIDKGKYTSTVFSNKIVLTFEDDFAVDPESPIKEYEIRIYEGNTTSDDAEVKDKRKKIESPTLGTQMFTGLKADTTYTIKIFVTNQNNVTSSLQLEPMKTAEIINPTFASSKIPDNPIDGYVKSEIVTVTYDDTKIENPIYYVKSTKKGTINVNVTEACGSGVEPTVCNSVTSTKTLEPNTWYKVAKETKITYEEDTNDTAYVYAITSDGNNLSKNRSGHTTLKIDNTNPELQFENQNVYSNKATIKITKFSDLGVGIDKITSCRYGTSLGNYNQNGAVNGNEVCALTGLTKETTYYYEICGQDKLNHLTCKTGNTASTGMVNPRIESPESKRNPSNPINGYVKRQEIDIIFDTTNVIGPSYYIKSDRAGTVTSGSIIQTCPTDGNYPKVGECSNSSGTKIDAEKWYRVSGNMSIAYDGNANDNPQVRAYLYDGLNFSGGTGTAMPLLKLDNTGPGLVLENGTQTTKSTTVNIKAFSDAGVGVNKITSCVYGKTTSYGSNGTISGNTSCRLNNLESGVTYHYQICGEDQLGNHACKTGNTATPVPPTPTFVYVNTPSNIINGYLQKQTIQVHFNKTNVENPVYYIKTTRSSGGEIASSSTNTLKSCGTGTMPSNCVNSNTNVLTSGTWYQVAGDIHITYSIHTDSNGSIIAMISDGINYKGSGTANIAKIDKKGPNITLGTATTSTNRIIVPITSFTDAGVGIDRITSCSSNGGIRTLNGNNNCTITGLNKNTNYTYTICGQDRFGNSSCVSGSAKTQDVTGKCSVSMTSAGRLNGFVDSQTGAVSCTAGNISSPTYFIKSTIPGKSNVNVYKCNTGTTVSASSCSSSSTTTIDENYWYRVSGSSVLVSYTQGYYSVNPKTLYTQLSDGKNFVNGASGTLDNVFYQANQITYGNHGKATVKDALDDLYRKLKEGSTSTQPSGGGNTGGSTSTQAS